MHLKYGDKIDDLELLQNRKLFDFVSSHRSDFTYAIGATTNYEVYQGPDVEIEID